MGNLDDADRHYLRLAVELSRGYRGDARRWPFGAIVVAGDKIAGQGINQVVELNDPTAHAEVMALRAAGQTLAAHQFEGAVLYSSSEPCPMCLAACYWAQLRRVVYAATVFDTSGNGVRDLAIYEEFRLPAEQRSLRQDASGGDLHDSAVMILEKWHDQFRSRRIEIKDGDQTVAAAEVEPSAEAGGTVRASLQATSGHVAPGKRANLVDAVMDLPEVQASTRLEAAVQRGDAESLERLRERTEDAVTRPAGSTTLVDADIPPAEPGAGS